MTVERLPRRDVAGQRKRRMDPVYKGGIGKRECGGGKAGEGRRFEMSHTGVRRRELLYNMAVTEAEVEECHGFEFPGDKGGGDGDKRGSGKEAVDADVMEVEEEL